MRRLSYLWDRRGPRDPFVARMEVLLAPLRWRRRRSRRPFWIAAAAGLIAAAFLLVYLGRPTPQATEATPTVATTATQPPTPDVRTIVERPAAPAAVATTAAERAKAAPLAAEDEAAEVATH